MAGDLSPLWGPSHNFAALANKKFDLMSKQKLPCSSLGPWSLAIFTVPLRRVSVVYFFPDEKKEEANLRNS